MDWGGHKRVLFCVAAFAVNATASGLGIGMGLLKEQPVAIAVFLTAIWTAWLVGMTYEFGPKVRAWWRARRGKRNGPPEYEVIQYWHQSVWDALFKLPRYPKVVRMRDTGEIMEWSHPTPEHLRPKDHS